MGFPDCIWWCRLRCTQYQNQAVMKTNQENSIEMIQLIRLTRKSLKQELKFKCSNQATYFMKQIPNQSENSTENSSRKHKRLRHERDHLCETASPCGLTWVRTPEYLSVGGMVMLSVAWWASSACLPSSGMLVTSTIITSFLMLLLNSTVWLWTNQHIQHIYQVYSNNSFWGGLANL